MVKRWPSMRSTAFLQTMSAVPWGRVEDQSGMNGSLSTMTPAWGPVASTRSSFAQSPR